MGPCRLINFDRNRPLVLDHFTVDDMFGPPELKSSAWCWGTPEHRSHWTTDPQVRQRKRWTRSLRWWGYTEDTNGRIVRLYPKDIW